MVDRVEGKKVSQRTDIQQTTGQNGENIKIESIFINEKLSKKIISIDKDNDGQVDTLTEEYYHKGNLKKTFTEEFKEGKVVEDKLDYKNTKKTDLLRTHEYNEDENSKTIKSWKNNKLVNTIKEYFNQDGKVIKREFDNNADGKMDSYQELTYNNEENSVIAENKNERGEIELRVKTIYNENGSFKSQEFDRDIDGTFEERFR